MDEPAHHRRSAEPGQQTGHGPSERGRRGPKLPVIGKGKGVVRNSEPTNAHEQMKAFIEDGVVPHFTFHASSESLRKRCAKERHRVATDLMPLATRILRDTLSRYGTDSAFFQALQGQTITVEESEAFLGQYLQDHRLSEHVHVKWTETLVGAGRFQEVGRKDDPSKRRLRIWIHESFQGIRTYAGVRMFAHHEICTHGLRALNDRWQPWATSR